MCNPYRTLGEISGFFSLGGRGWGWGWVLGWLVRVHLGPPCPPPNKMASSMSRAKPTTENSWLSTIEKEFLILCRDVAIGKWQQVTASVYSFFSVGTPPWPVRNPWTTPITQVQGPLELTDDGLPKLMDYLNFNKSSAIISQTMVCWGSPRTRGPRNVSTRSFDLIYRSLSFPTFSIVLEWRSTFLSQRVGEERSWLNTARQFSKSKPNDSLHSVG